MSMKLKQYPQYKESGVLWLGMIPEDWEVYPLRRVARIQLSNVDKRTVDGEIPVRLCNYTDVYYRKFITQSVQFMTASALPREIDKFVLEKGDVLITKDSESWTDIAVPAYVVENLPDVLCGYHLAHIRPYPAIIRGEYLFRAFQADSIAYQFRVAANGVTRFGLSGHSIAVGLFTVPSLAEQDAIAAFLRHTDKRISHFICVKHQQIRLLNEQKRAIINRIMTQGLDPNVRMKPSGVEWLGDMPEHWTLIRLKFLGQIRYGLSQPPRESCIGVPFIRATNIKSGEIIKSRMLSVSPDDVPPGRNAFLRANEIIVVRSGAYAADSAIIPVEYDGAVAGYDMVLSVEAADPGFIAFALLSEYVLVDQLFLVRDRAAQPHLNAEDLGNTLIMLPPWEEQRCLADALRASTVNLDQAISVIEHEINLLQEYRTRLITDVVTGKLDVRDVELPDVDVMEYFEEWYAEEKLEQEEMLEAEEMDVR